MRKIGALSLFLAAAFLFIGGCGEDEQGVDETGVRIRCLAFDTSLVRIVIGDETRTDTIISAGPCLTFGLSVFIDGEYQGRMSSNEPQFFSLPAGSHTMSGESNVVWDEIQRNAYYCFENIEFTVSDGEMSTLVLNATHPLCILGED